MLDAFYTAGDTANNYREGEPEQFTGEWAHGLRDQMVIATKVRGSYHFPQERY